MKKSVYIITAAGGNATAIEILDEPKTRLGYSEAGRALINDNQDWVVEQSGFLIISQNHFEMSGAEFCGNAARAVAILFSQLQAKEMVEFTMSGFSGKVKANVKSLASNKFEVECHFPGLPLKTTELSLESPATLVDLGGIVHVVIEADFPENGYTTEHKRIIELLNLEQREAVGVIWSMKNGQEAKIDPVVWVKEINSFFYESSCGSGSIAAAKVLGVERIIQPSGQAIEVIINPNEVILKSEMEVGNGLD